MISSAEHKELLFVAEVAAELRVDPVTVRRAIKKGELEAVRLGQHGRYRVTREELDRFLMPAAAPAADTDDLGGLLLR